MDPKEQFIEELNKYYGYLCVLFRDWHYRRAENGAPAPDELEQELRAVEALLRFYNRHNEEMKCTR
jgi:hypothetical protein